MITRCRFEWKIEDMWVGVFWKRGYATTSRCPVHLWTDVWICFVPCFPLHLTILKNVMIDLEEPLT